MDFLNRSNNSVNNLEWCSHKYNLNYGNRNSKLSNSLTNNPFFSIPVLQYSKTREFLKEFPSIAEADTQLGTVKRKTAYGYIWKFKTL
jgi:hypothetical protein